MFRPVPAPVKPPPVFDLRPSFLGPAPGSVPARAAGCTCPRFVNHHGKGAPGSAWGETPPGRFLWYVDRGCPLHRPAAAPGA